jgi:uncharacterized protein (DUF1919 family)
MRNQLLKESPLRNEYDLMKDPVNTAFDMSLDYLVGFFETDGSAQIIFKEDKTMTLGYRLLPTVVFSQKHTQILDGVRDLLMAHQIPTRFEVGKGRASNLRIEGLISVKKFITLLAEYPLYSSKWIDLFIMRAVYSIIEENRHNSPDGRLQIIDLKFHMHSFSLEDASKKKQSKSLSRKEWELRHKQPVGSSTGKAQKVLEKMYVDYQKHVLETQVAIGAQRLQIRGDYISGLIDGDGWISFHISPPQKGLSFSCSLGLCVEKGALLLLEVFCYYFQENFERKSKLKSFHPRGKAAHVYSTSNKAILQKLAEHAEKYPLVGKRSQIEVLNVFLKMSKSDRRDKMWVCNFIKLIYKNSPDRRIRKKTLDELLLEVENLFGYGSKPVTPME